MDDRVDGVLLEGCPDSFSVAEIRFDEGTEPHGFAMAAGQVVEHHDGMASLGQKLGTMAADVPGTAGNENPHMSDYCLTERVVGKSGWVAAGDWRSGRLEEACMPSLEERIASLETRLDVAESTLAIERLKAEYAARVDARHTHLSGGTPDPAHVSAMAARVAELFTEDAVWDGGRSLGVARGRAQIRDRLANPTVRWAWHFFLKPRITVRGDFAEGTWDLFSPCTLQDGSQRWMVGVESDTYQRVDGVWLHASMQLETVMLAPFEKGWSGGVS